MMRRWALVSGITIQAVVEQDSEPQIDGQWVELTPGFGPGDAAVDGRLFKAESPALAAYLAQKEAGGN